MKIAVYGTLRKNQSNNSCLEGATLLGEFESDPIYTMYSVYDNYPALKENGYTSIKFEVYDIKSRTDILKRIDQLEGFINKNNKNNHYNRKIIETPYGKAFVYIINDNEKYSKLKKIITGDWVDYIDIKQRVNNYE